MSTTLTTTRFHGAQTAVSRSLPHVMCYLRLTFIRGPKQLITSRISVSCATAMALMCSPALLLCALLTIPGMIFQSPYQNAYYHFSRVLELDPTRWFVLALAGVCAIMSLALPATMPEPREADDSLF